VASLGFVEAKMFSFLQSGWFWLLVGSILLLLAGCVLMPRKADIETPTSPHPLFTMTVVPFSTETLELNYLEPSLSFSLSPSPSRIQRQVSPPADDDYYVEAPNCFPSANGGYSCIARVWNNSSTASGSILLKISLPNQEFESFSIEQRLIPSQSFAPYRAIIPPIEANSPNFEAKIERLIPVDTRYRNLNVVDSRGQMNNTGRYRLTTTIENNVGERLENVQIFASLVDDEQRLVGYRIYEVEDDFDAGERRVVELEIIPQALPFAVHHELHVEGRVIGE
jgi:hypothetical protein